MSSKLPLGNSRYKIILYLAVLVEVKGGTHQENTLSSETLHGLRISVDHSKMRNITLGGTSLEFADRRLECEYALNFYD